MSIEYITLDPLLPQIAKLDWLVWVTSFLGTVFLGVEAGLAIAIGLVRVSHSGNRGLRRTLDLPPQEMSRALHIPQSGLC